MRKLMKAFLLFFSFMVGLCILCSCKTDVKIKENDETTQAYIKQEYLNFYLSDESAATIADVTIWYFLGIYDNAYVAVFMDNYYRSAFLCANWKENIGGVYFIYPDSNVILVYKNHRFYTLKYAYECGILTLDHIKAIQQIFNK